MKLIGIIGAMEVEVASLKEMMTDVTIRTKASMEFNHGYLNGKEVVVVRSGNGKVNAGICTQILVDDYGVDCVINTGIAGSLRNEINIGDIVISTDAVQHDMDVRIFGYPLGEIPQMGVLSFQADEHLAEVAEEVCKEVNPEIPLKKQGQKRPRREENPWFSSPRGRRATGAVVSRVLSLDGHLSRICVATNLMRFLPKTGRATLVVLSNLASSGVYRATFVTKGAVVSYATFPPLPTKVGGLFLLHFPWSHLHRTLSGILPCEARTFLTCKNAAAITYPTHIIL